jgi:hypothetical protein
MTSEMATSQALNLKNITARLSQPFTLSYPNSII